MVSLIQTLHTWLAATPARCAGETCTSTVCPQLQAEFRRSRMTKLSKDAMGWVNFWPQHLPELLYTPERLGCPFIGHTTLTGHKVMPLSDITQKRTELLPINPPSHCALMLFSPAQTYHYPAYDPPPKKCDPQHLPLHIHPRTHPHIFPPPRQRFAIRYDGALR